MANDNINQLELNGRLYDYSDEVARASIDELARKWTPRVVEPSELFILPSGMSFHVNQKRCYVVGNLLCITLGIQIQNMQISAVNGSVNLNIRLTDKFKSKLETYVITSGTMDIRDSPTGDVIGNANAQCNFAPSGGISCYADENVKGKYITWLGLNTVVPFEGEWD